MTGRQGARPGETGAGAVRLVVEKRGLGRERGAIGPLREGELPRLSPRKRGFVGRAGAAARGSGW